MNSALMTGAEQSINNTFVKYLMCFLKLSVIMLPFISSILGAIYAVDFLYYYSDFCNNSTLLYIIIGIFTCFLFVTLFLISRFYWNKYICQNILKVTLLFLVIVSVSSFGIYNMVNPSNDIVKCAAYMNEKIILYIRIMTIILSVISCILLLKILVELYKKYLLKCESSKLNNINETINKNTSIRYEKYIY